MRVERDEGASACHVCRLLSNISMEAEQRLPACHNDQTSRLCAHSSAHGRELHHFIILRQEGIMSTLRERVSTSTTSDFDREDDKCACAEAGTTCRVLSPHVMD